MKLANFIYLGFLLGGQACSNYKDCVNQSKLQIQECLNDIDCRCVEMGHQVACYEDCLGEEEAAKARAALVQEMMSQCRPILRAGPTPVRAKLLAPTPEPKYTREVYYDALQFEAATDPVDYYATVAVYQSMPEPGAYSNFLGPSQMGSTPPSQSPPLWPFLLVSAYFSF
ncbi:hypothetical protein DSO57_1018961 [Entomophthora muscae]|uniref:Uncharacterized protein n=1 Tax=Entomophthora muscae TaxID=34485 RepID=A0ACC2TEX1_9FUNG|nr:hypothetical protein DSO57_1018961 [Entomophthora muscae]